MKWATRRLVHFDRVASAWLILRFVDHNASFVFLAEQEDVPEGVIGFGIRGARFDAHNGSTTSFEQLRAAYVGDDEALKQMATIVGSAVRQVMNDAVRATGATESSLISGVLGITEGLMLLSGSDEACIRASLVLYDALYARLTAQKVIEEQAPSPPASVLAQTIFLSQSIDKSRDQGISFVELFVEGTPSRVD